MLQSDNDVFHWRKFIEQTEPRSLASLYFEGFLMLTNEHFKNKWLTYMASLRQDFAILGERAVYLPFKKEAVLAKPLLRKIKLISSEKKRSIVVNNCLIFHSWITL